jgi:hypothetical protein
VPFTPRFFSPPPPQYVCMYVCMYVCIIRYGHVYLNIHIT